MAVCAILKITFNSLIVFFLIVLLIAVNFLNCTSNQLTVLIDCFAFQGATTSEIARMLKTKRIVRIVKKMSSSE